MPKYIGKTQIKSVAIHPLYVGIPTGCLNVYKISFIFVIAKLFVFYKKFVADVATQCKDYAHASN